MNWQNQAGTEDQLASTRQLDQPQESPRAAQSIRGQPATPELKVAKHSILLQGKDAEVFTLSLGSETIELLPHKNWGQLDMYKWCMRGKLPGTPAGLDITADHVKLSGEIVSVKEADACAKLQRLFNEWIDLERETLQLAKRKSQPKPATGTSTPAQTAEERLLHFQVELDKEGQVHILAVKGKETLAVIGLNALGFQSLVNQGLMRKPHSVKTGALHDWVELDGVLYSFEHGNNDAAFLAKTLNDSYLPATNFGHGKEVIIYANAASSTGFDIQFPAKVGGLTESRRRPLNEEALDLLQDHERCAMLHKGIVVKLTRPTLIFKQKTAEGGEQYLPRTAANVVRVVDEDGGVKTLDLSQPVSYLHLSAVELTAVFNHPAVNRHTQAQDSSTAEKAPPRSPPRVVSPSPQAASGSVPAPAVAVRVSAAQPPAAIPAKSEAAVEKKPDLSPPHSTAPEAELLPAAHSRLSQFVSPANDWVKPLLEQQPLRFDWLTSLIYAKIAAWFGNSAEGTFLDAAGWFIHLSEVDEFGAPGFKGIFLTNKGAFGFYSEGLRASFEDGRLAAGALDTTVKADGVHLRAVGLSSMGHVVFVIGEGNLTPIPDPNLSKQLAELSRRGAVLTSVAELLKWSEPLEVIWTAPVDQSDPSDPQAFETLKPGHAPGLPPEQRMLTRLAAASCIVDPARSDPLSGL